MSHYFGPPAAQDDTELLDYFYISDQFDNTFLKKKKDNDFLYVTRAGTGKTALIKWLNSENVKRNKIYISPAKYTLVCNDDDLSIENYKNLLTIELYIGIIESFKSKIVGDLKTECDEYTNDNWWNEATNWLGERFSGIQIFGSGFTLEPKSRNQYLNFIKQTDQIDNTRAILEKISQELDILVIVDNIEHLVVRGLDELEVNNVKRIGAFLSVLNNLSKLGIQVAAFTKEYVLQSVKLTYIDYRHFSSEICGINWSLTDLGNIIKERVEKRLKLPWEDVFNFDFDYLTKELLKYLINGPRDLIQVCNLAGKSGNPITKDIMLQEFKNQIDETWNQIQVQYKKDYIHIDILAKTIIDLLIKNDLSDFNKADFISTLSKEFESPNSELSILRKHNWIYPLPFELEKVLELLFLVGIFGYKEDSIPYFAWQGRSINNFNNSNNFFISPLFLI